MSGKQQRPRAGPAGRGLVVGRLFSPPVFGEPDLDRRARQLNAILWTLLGTLALMFGLSFLQPHIHIPGLVLIYSTLISVLLGCIAILRHGHVQASALGLSVAILSAVTSASWFYGGLASQIPANYLIVVLVVSMTLGSRWGMGFSVLAVGAVMFLAVAGVQGWLPPAPHDRNELDHWPPLVAGLLMTSVLIHITLTNLTHALARAHANELAHERSVIELQASQATTERRARQGAAIGGLGQELLEARSREELAELTLAVLGETLGAKRVTVFEIHPTTNQARVMAPAPTSRPTATAAWSDLTPAAQVALENATGVTRFAGDEPTGLPCCGSVDWVLLAPIPGRLASHGLVCAGFVGIEPGETEEVFLATAVGVLSSAMEREQADHRVRQAQRLEAVGQLAGGIAHDFNNLLTAILACSQLLLRKLPDGSDESTLANDIKASGDRAALLTQQLLAFSRRDVITSGTSSAAEVVAGLEGILRRLLGEHIQIITDLEGDLPLVRADRANLEQVVMNLCVNARDAMPNGGDLRITLRQISLEQLPEGLDLSERRYVILEVSDTGEGIADEHRERIFEPFFSTKEHGRGTGLGLSTVFGVARGVGGAVQVESAVNRGTTFTVYLPVRADDAISTAPTYAVANLSHGSEKVLIVEDNHLVRRATESTLENAGYEVVSAANGFDALALLESEAVELVLSDLRMPRMGGVAMAQQLEARGLALPILFMTGYAADVDDLPARIRHNLIRKPYKAEDLLQRVRAALDAHHERATRPAS